MSLIDRIKYDAPSDDVLAWKYASDQIKMGAQLIVNESQEAIFFKGGKALDVFGPGTHTLDSGNIPLLSGIVNLPFGGQTPFSAEVWYVNKTVKRDLKWGTSGPIQLVDPLYKFPVSVRAFGRWGMRVADARSFIVQLVGTQISSNNLSGGYIGSHKIEEFFAGEILQQLTNALANYFVSESFSIFQASAHINELSAFVSRSIGPEFQRFGIEIISFNVERVSIPEEEQKQFQAILGKRMEIEEVSRANLGQSYISMRTFDTLEKAASNEGGSVGQLLGAGLGMGIGVGAGFPIGREISGVMNTQQQPDNSNAALSRLQALKQMLDAELISQQDYEQTKKRILDSI